MADTRVGNSLDVHGVSRRSESTTYLEPDALDLDLDFGSNWKSQFGAGFDVDSTSARVNKFTTRAAPASPPAPGTRDPDAKFAWMRARSKVARVRALSRASKKRVKTIRKNDILAREEKARADGRSRSKWATAEEKRVAMATREQVRLAKVAAGQFRDMLRDANPIDGGRVGDLGPCGVRAQE